MLSQRALRRGTLHPSRRASLVLLTALVVSAAAPLLGAVRHSVAQPARTSRAAIAPLPLALPVQFEQNQGQADPAVRFLAPAPGGTLFLTANEMVLSLTARSSHSPAATAGHAGHSPAPAAPAPQAVIRMGLIGGAASPQLVGLDPQATSRNYVVGERSHWHFNVPSFARVAYRNVYPASTSCSTASQVRPSTTSWSPLAPAPTSSPSTSRGSAPCTSTATATSCSRPPPAH